MFQPADDQPSLVGLYPLTQSLLGLPGASRQLQFRFRPDDHPCSLGQQHKDLAFRLQQALQQTQPVGRPGSAGESKRNPLRHEPIPTPLAIIAARIGINITK